ncbi:hypothetical protein [Halovivax sp.]|uniref:hypothetical protein n=1 Tax=Halovivax sp. TaxID=1935978 RepID=UPI0025BFEAF0|nr:hypothetical protein [Halovivax sp.]
MPRSDMNEAVAAVAGVQLTIAGFALGVLFDFEYPMWEIAAISVLVGSGIVVAQLMSVRGDTDR